MVLVFNVSKVWYQHSTLFYLIPRHYRRMQSIKISVEGVSAHISTLVRLANLVQLLSTTKLQVHIAER
jgi:hypothetical protein